MAHPAAGGAALCRSALIFKSMQCITAVHSSLQNSTLYYSAEQGSGLALEWPFCTINQFSMFSWNTRHSEPFAPLMSGGGLWPPGTAHLATRPQKSFTLPARLIRILQDSKVTMLQACTLYTMLVHKKMTL